MTGNFVRTCGYTGPGIGILLQLFEHNHIFNKETLHSFLTIQHLSEEQFMDIINETIGNLLDIMPVCPITQTTRGISGLLVREQSKSTKPEEEMKDENEEPPIIYKVSSGGSNLKPGANVISFTSRTHGCDTIHHAVLYIVQKLNTCYIIDSWSTSNPTDFDKHCRPLVSRPHHIDAVYAIIDELNSNTIIPERTFQILSEYFLAHDESIRQTIIAIRQVTVHTINPLYLHHIYTESERLIRSGSTHMESSFVSSFGGKTRKRYIIKNKKNKKNKKISRTKKYSGKTNRKYKKIYRRANKRA